MVSLAFRLAAARRNKVTSIDKANVLESSRLWRKLATELSLDHPDVKLDHQLVDSSAMRLITQDLAQLQPRATREELGETYQPSLLADPSAQFPLELSRGGWANPAGLPRGTVLRVAYSWEDDKLIRWHWSVMDRTLSTPPVRAEICAYR